ncbi:hypothetical protein Tco_0812431 [Tanacetum coccineum]
MANKKIEGLETKIEGLETKFTQFRTETNDRFAAMQEETSKRFDEVMKALAALSAKIQSENEKPDTGPQYDDLGFLMNTQNLKESFDPKQKKVEGVDKNSSEFKVGFGSNGMEYTGGSKKRSFGADFRFRKLKMPIFEGEDAHG